MRTKDLSEYLSLSFGNQLDHVNQLHGSKKIDHIISSPYALKLTRRLPEEEVYLTLKEVGEEDALPLFELTNFRQAQYIYDLEWWDKDYMNPDKIVFWLSLMLESNGLKLMEWIRNSALEFLVAVFKKLIKIHAFDNPDELKGDVEELYYFTVDNLYYIEFLNEKHEDILKKVLLQIRDRARDQYYELMQWLIWSNESEIEEAAADLRRSRLELKGFREIHEAMSIYQPLPVYLRDKMFLSDVRPRSVEEHEQSPLYALDKQKKSLFLSDVLESVPSGPLLDRIRFELVHLSHRILVTDNLKPDYKTLQHSLKKAFSMVNIGLEQLCQADREKAFTAIDNNFMEHIFRVGYEPIMKLHYRVIQLFNTMDQKTREFWIQFMENPWSDILKAVMKTRPRFCAPLPANPLPVEREFENIRDIQVTGDYVDQAELILKLFKDRLGFKLDMPLLAESPLVEALSRDIDWIKLYNTVFIQFITGGNVRMAPLDMQQLPLFFERCITKNETVKPGDESGLAIHSEFSARFRDELLRQGLLFEEEVDVFLSLGEAALLKLLEQFDGISLDRGTSLDYRLFPGLWFHEEFQNIM